MRNRIKLIENIGNIHIGDYTLGNSMTHQVPCQGMCGHVEVVFIGKE